VVSLFGFGGYLSPIIPKTSFIEGYEFYWFVGIPALLFLWAGVRLQSKINKQKAKQPKLEYRLIPFPQSGTRILKQDEDERQKGYAQIGITNKGGKAIQCYGILKGISCIQEIRNKPFIHPLTFTNEHLSWYSDGEYITIPNDGVERYLNLAYIDQHISGVWKLAIKGKQKKDYGMGWWKLDITISSEETLTIPLTIEIALGLGDREKPASGLNLCSWDKWYEARQKDLKQVFGTQD